MEMVGWDVLEEMELALMTMLGWFCLVLGTSPPAMLRAQGGERQAGDIKPATELKPSAGCLFYVNLLASFTSAADRHCGDLQLGP